jgi:hypothetical protein
VKRIERYREGLRALDDWEPFLLAESGLPGPRANLELVRTVAEEADEPRALRLAASEDEFLAMCGVAALGRLVAEGKRNHLPRLRKLAVDTRWRVREAVAIALQLWGENDFNAMAKEAANWANGSPLEQRAAVAAVCEPHLLQTPEAARRALALVEHVTTSLPRSRDRVLRQALGYCWSVAVAAEPDDGRPAMELWLVVDNPAIRWVMRENLRKTRLTRTDADWTRRWIATLGQT